MDYSVFFPGLPLNHSKVNLIPFCRERISTKKLNLCSLWLSVSDEFVEIALLPGRYLWELI